MSVSPLTVKLPVFPASAAAVSWIPLAETLSISIEVKVVLVLELAIWMPSPLLVPATVTLLPLSVLPTTKFRKIALPLPTEPLDVRLVNVTLLPRVTSFRFKIWPVAVLMLFVPVVVSVSSEPAVPLASNPVPLLVSMSKPNR